MMIHKMYKSVCVHVGGTKIISISLKDMFELLSHSHTEAETHTHINQTCMTEYEMLLLQNTFQNIIKLVSLCDSERPGGNPDHWTTGMFKTS